MLHLFLVISLIISLLLIAYYDIKYRLVSIFNYLALLVLSLLLVADFHVVIKNSIFNSCFSTFLFSLVYIYFRKIRKDTTQFIDSKIGKGDIAYFISIAPLFHFINFIIYINIALIFSLITHLVILKFTKLRHDSIPLAGYMAITLTLIIIILETNQDLFLESYHMESIFITYIFK